MNQEKKAKIAAQLKLVVPKSWKYSLSVRNHSTICMTIKSAPINLVEAYLSRDCSDDVRESCLRRMNCDVNPYHWEKSFEGELLELFTKIFDALNIDNFDKSDSQSDYFHVGHYVDVELGKWNKPFVVTAK